MKRKRRQDMADFKEIHYVGNEQKKKGKSSFQDLRRQSTRKTDVFIFRYATANPYFSFFSFTPVVLISRKLTQFSGIISDVILSLENPYVSPLASQKDNSLTSANRLPADRLKILIYNQVTLHSCKGKQGLPRNMKIHKCLAISIKYRAKADSNKSSLMKDTRSKTEQIFLFPKTPWMLASRGNLNITIKIKLILTKSVNVTNYRKGMHP